MKRRDFIKTSAAAGLIGLAGARCSSVKQTAAPHTGPGFDVHPFVKNHPEAVFIKLTSVESKRDTQGIHDAGYELAQEILVKTSSGGYPNSTRISCKPNWTCNGRPDLDHEAKLGITTDLNFVEGYLKGVKEKGPRQFFLRECACPYRWEANGYTGMAERNGFDLRDLSSKDFWDLEPDDLDVVEVHDATSISEYAFMEDLGVCGPGEAKDWIDQGWTELDGKVAFNTSGGLVTKGHPVGATGLGMIAEIVWQLRGEAEERQVENPRVGLTLNGGGVLGTEPAAMSIHIFKK